MGTFIQLKRCSPDPAQNQQSLTAASPTPGPAPALSLPAATALPSQEVRLPAPASPQLLQARDGSILLAGRPRTWRASRRSRRAKQRAFLFPAPRVILRAQHQERDAQTSHRRGQRELSPVYPKRLTLFPDACGTEPGDDPTWRSPDVPAVRGPGGPLLSEELARRAGPLVSSSAPPRTGRSPLIERGGLIPSGPHGPQRPPSVWRSPSRQARLLTRDSVSPGESPGNESHDARGNPAFLKVLGSSGPSPRPRPHIRGPSALPFRGPQRVGRARGLEPPAAAPQPPCCRPGPPQRHSPGFPTRSPALRPGVAGGPPDPG